MWRSIVGAIVLTMGPVVASATAAPLGGPPPNDLCENAILLTVPDSAAGFTTDATIDDEFPLCGTSITAPGIWYSVIGTGNRITATTCSEFTEYDTKISVYCNSCADPICVGGNDDDCAPFGLLSTVQWCSQEGTEYLILVHGFGTATGGFVLSIFDDGVACDDPVDCGAGPGCVEQVQDPGFEGGTPNADWAEASTNFGTPLCTVAFCGTGTGTGPNTGSWWAWFGGIAAFEDGSVSQNVVIPSGANTLTFWLEQIVCDSPADFLEVLIDGQQVFLTDGASPLCGVLGYTQQSVDISAFADGGVHSLEFHSTIFANNGGGSNFFVDDVSILACPNPCPADFDLSGAVDVKDLLFLLGAWGPC